MKVLAGRMTLAIVSTMALTACGTIRATETVTITPSKVRIQAAARDLVCGSFRPIGFSEPKDSAQTVREIREHNAAFDTFGCGKRQRAGNEP